MSGGHFDYGQYRFAEIADEIKNIIKNNKKKDWYNYSDKTLDEFKKGIDLIEKAEIYAQRIDWLVSGDDGEEYFHERLAEDLRKLMPKINEI